MGFRALRVLNEDWIAGGGGFPMHSHQDMEIVTFIMEGALEHKDTLGHSGVIRKGEVQWMSAGTGIEHSEFNPSPTEKTHLYQMWILPDRKGLAPAYAQQAISKIEGDQNFSLLASSDGRKGSIKINQDLDLLMAKLSSKGIAEYRVRPGRHVWVQAVEGDISLNERRLATGDGAAVSDLEVLRFEALEPSSLLLFDLA